MRLMVVLCWAYLGSSPAVAEVPFVATDIAPVHSLVAQVMHGVGVPELILRPGVSPHDYALRPSEAAALSRADLVIWMGPDLTPWLEGAIASLAGDAAQVELLTAAGTIRRAFREGADFAARDYENHTHNDVDPHGWLDPVNGQIWLRLIAAELSELDPENRDIYAANAVEGVAELEVLIAELDQILGPMRGLPYLVTHDAYQYFEARFNIPAVGAIIQSDAARPGPARIAELRKLVVEQGVRCVLVEPQSTTRLVHSIFPTGAKTGVLDPMGMGIALGRGHYSATLRALAIGYTGCLR